MKKILFALLFLFTTIAFSQFDGSVDGWVGNAFYVSSGTVYSEGVTVVDEGTLASESLNETDYATHAKWDVTNDFDDSGGNAAFAWSANQTSTLTQIQANLAIAGVDAVWYLFTYTVTVTTAFDGDGVATITTGFASSAVTLDLSAGTHSVYFKSKTTPVDFVISIVSGSDTEGTFEIDDVTLKEIQGGNVDISGTLLVRGVDISAHATSDGSSHSFINQDVTDTGTPTFASETLSNFLQITPTASQTHVEGKMYYDSDLNAFVIYNNESEVEIILGKGMLRAVRNASGSDISKGLPVYISGAVGQLPTIELTDADVTGTADFAGLTAHLIENNSNGYILYSGTLRNIDTDGSPYGETWTDGEVLYISQTTGELTDTRPTSAYVNQVGYVAYAHTTLGRLGIHEHKDWATDFRVGTLAVMNGIELGGNVTGTGYWQAGVHAFGKGGTGLSTWTQYLIPYAATTTSIGQIAIGTNGQVLTSAGAGVAPSFEDVAAGGDFSDGGEVGGAARTLGNTDGYNMGFITNNVERAYFGATTGHFLPNGNGAYDLGGVSLNWNNFYALIAYIGTLYADGLWHKGDFDTKIAFESADEMQLYAGNTKFIEMVESTSDYLSIGESADINILTNYAQYDYGLGQYKFTKDKLYDINATYQSLLKEVTYNVTETELYADRGNIQILTLTGDIGTLDFNPPEYATDAMELTLMMVQDATGSRVVTAWDASVLWAGGVAPTLSTGANAVDILKFLYDGTNYHGWVAVADSR